MRQIQTRPGLLIFLLCFLSAGLSLKAQNLVMSNNSLPAKEESRPESLAGVLARLEAAFDIYFGYDHKLIEDIRVPAKLKRIIYADAEQQLDYLLKPLDLHYVKISEKDYVIRAANEAAGHRPDAEKRSFGEVNRGIGRLKVMPEFRGFLSRKQQTVSGRVSDELGEPLPGVSVIRKGTEVGTSTDIDGRYSLNVPAGENTVLVFTMMGYGTREETVGSRSEINVQLASDASQLDEVVITALGISRETRSLGYSVGEVDGEEMDNVGNESLLTSLSGRVSGVTINQTSGIGSTSSIIIRGASSLGNNQPLFVVDGVPISNTIGNVVERGSGNKVDYGNPISDINPDDIASISVLKGPSAAALYGSRAGNGVILITTKSGAKGEGLGVNFSSSNVFEVPYRFLDLHYKYANGERPFLLDEASAYWGGIPLDQGHTAVQWNSPLDENGNPIPTELKSYPDNMKNFLETGITSTNNLSVSGSTEKSTFRLSYSNMTHNGLIPNSDLHRNNLSANGSFNILENLSVSSNINFTRSNSKSRPSTSERTGNPLQHVYDWPHVDIRELKNYWMLGQENIQQVSPAPGDLDNPYFLAYELKNAYTRDRIFGNVRLDWTILPGLTAFARLAHDTYNENRETRIPWSYSD
ncbi:MAG TPA: SusC/RagA family TonB-linked outer membrane protein, partial [Anseongella sp.]|nr:SusC/RagA family TonB-linked outer membrane protein [Anseongella sp.]